MYLIVEENKNSTPDERVFAESGTPKNIRRIKIDTPFGPDQWCVAAAVEEGGQFASAQAVQVEDSADGTVWLVFGGMWGVRFRREVDQGDWALDNTAQWGLPFLVLDSSTAIDFK
jgi:hypothetical protein